MAEMTNMINFAYTKDFIFGTGMTRKQQVTIQKTPNPIIPAAVNADPGPMVFLMCAILGKMACSMT